jgi:hypothetical protein
MNSLRDRYGIKMISTVLLRYWRGSVRMAVQSGRHDLFGSMLTTASILTPLWAAPVTAQVGVGATEQILCSPGRVNIAQLIALGLGLMSMYFLLKFLWRLMTGFDKAGEVRPDRNPAVNRRKKRRYLELQIRDSSYSLLAALLPILIPVVLQVAGINTVSCLFG